MAERRIHDTFTKRFFDIRAIKWLNKKNFNVSYDIEQTAQMLHLTNRFVLGILYSLLVVTFLTGSSHCSVIWG